ncbi:MAG TPA: gephyrin-like molybdotransferase Glp [Terriglobales bacterium]|nr:gephyrin-like molybdotransferase Glp [Terriglobales bacterium]
MASQPQSAAILSFDQAYDRVLRYCGAIAPPGTETVLLPSALGRVLAEGVNADRDFPPFPRSTRDGYAVRAADLATIPASLNVIGQIRAGGSFSGKVSPGKAVEIMTGAAVPAGADAVVMVEHVSREGDTLLVPRSAVLGENVVAQGAEAKAGQELLSRGMRVGPAQIGMAAAVGKARLTVYRKPSVAVLATGDELVEVDEIPGPQQIRNSNSYSLEARIAQYGGEPLRLPIAPDEERKLATLIHAALENSQMLLLSGGVSMGKFDLVEAVLARLGATFFFTGAEIQPGRPVVFGEITAHGRKIPFLGLPGNPVSVMVTFDLFARPVLQAFAGAKVKRLTAARAQLRTQFKTKTGLTRFLPARLSGGVFDPQVEVVPWKGSGDMLALARANCYLVVPPDREQLEAGEMVSVLFP